MRYVNNSDALRTAQHPVSFRCSRAIVIFLLNRIIYKFPMLDEFYRTQYDELRAKAKKAFNAVIDNCTKYLQDRGKNNEKRKGGSVYDQIQAMKRTRTLIMDFNTDLDELNENKRKLLEQNASALEPVRKKRKIDEEIKSTQKAIKTLKNYGRSVCKFECYYRGFLKLGVTRFRM